MAPWQRVTLVAAGAGAGIAATFSGLKECFTEVTLRDVAQRNFIIAREDEVVFNVMTRLARRGASMAVVIKGRGRPYASHVIGIISKDHIADSVAERIRPYTG
jgi:CIC family chloride channel protein